MLTYTSSEKLHRLAIEDPSQQAYLNALKFGLSESKPALVFDWDTNALRMFVDGANNTSIFAIRQPGYISTVPGTMTTTTLRADIVRFITHVGVAGGCHHGIGSIIIAPENMNQYETVVTLLRDLEKEPWVQTVFQAVVPSSFTLAAVYSLTRRSFTKATPIGRVAPPPGFRLVFA